MDLADFNRDGRIDLVYTRRGRDEATIFLSTEKREPSGLPVFEPAGTVSVAGWEACRAVDFNRDGSLDLVVDGTLVLNMNGRGWPFQPGSPILLKAGRHPCFLDLDGDGRLDAVSLEKLSDDRPDGCRVVWRRNLSDDPPRFSDSRRLNGIDAGRCNLVSVVRDKNTTGLLVQHDMHQSVSLYLQDDMENAPPRFRHIGRAESVSAVLSLGDQAWPCFCDWDADGDLDLLVGGGYGWPRIVINNGSDRAPVYAEPRLIHADGKPIRFLRNEILGPPHHWHNMGYSYPLFVDWDADGLSDLICPNETNRIFWYKNVGTKQEPRFANRRQLEVVGYPESAASRRRSAERAVEAVYPREAEQPFFWRTGAAVADFNGDQLHKIVREGDTFDVNPDSDMADLRTISSTSLIVASNGEDGTGSALNRSGEFAFELRFSDGTSGVFTGRIIPEPSMMVMLLNGLSILACAKTWRRRG